jgi:hypothetical protein
VHHRIADFYKEVDENINMNYTFSIEDIKDEQPLDILDDIVDPAEEIPVAPAPSADQSPSQIPESSSTIVSNTLVASPNDENALVPIAVETLPKFKSLSMMIPS